MIKRPSSSCSSAFCIPIWEAIGFCLQGQRTLVQAKFSCTSYVMARAVSDYVMARPWGKHPRLHYAILSLNHGSLESRAIQIASGGSLLFSSSVLCQEIESNLLKIAVPLYPFLTSEQAQKKCHPGRSRLSSMPSVALLCSLVSCTKASCSSLCSSSHPLKPSCVTFLLSR